jgi:cobalt-zinc-cadmium efflux system membrane fusion protein
MKFRWLPILGIMVVLIAGAYLLWTRWPTSGSAETQAAADGAGQPVTDLVTFSPEKMQAAGLQTTAAQRRWLVRTSTVPGRLQYEGPRHVEIAVATPGMIVGVTVRTGERVTDGQVLATLSSPEIGDARADVLLRQSELRVARQKQEWEQSTCYGLEQLAEAVRLRVSLRELSERFAELTLGAAREKVLSAYSRLQLAEQLASAVESPAATGVVAGRTVRQRQSERERALAALDAELEQSLFDARLRFRQAENAVADAERRLRVSQHHLITLLGMPNDSDFTDPAELEPSRFSQVDVRAPLAGTIERVVRAPSERVQSGDVLFELADTSRLWVSADLREREFPDLSLDTGDVIAVTAAARPRETLSATVHHVGREVDPQTNALPLVATLENPDGHLRPGMFARVTVPLGPARHVLAVPESAIVEHEGDQFVFVPAADREFRRVDVTTGISQDGWTEIVCGLEEGVLVASQGTFYLKSELLLEKEEE